MTESKRAILGVLLSAALAIACGDGSRPLDPLGLNIIVTPSAVTYTVRIADDDKWPLANCTVDFIAKPVGVGKATWESADLRWFMGTNRSVATDSEVVSATEMRQSWEGGDLVPGATLHSPWQFWGNFPFDLEVKFHYSVEGTSELETSTTRFTCGPALTATVPPKPTLVNFASLALTPTPSPGDTLAFQYHATSPAGIWATQLVAVGAFEKTVNEYENREKDVDRTARIGIPRGNALGSPFSITAFAIDPFAQFAGGTVQMPVLTDVRPPTLEAVQGAIHCCSGYFPTLGGTFFVGDTARIFLIARDNHQMHYVLWETLPFGTRDSILQQPTDMSVVEMHIPVRIEWGDSVVFRIRARDVSGNFSDAVTTQPGDYRVYPSVTHPSKTINVDGEVQQVLVDTKRNVAYVLQVGRARILVLSLASLTFTPLALDGSPSGMDLTPGGDSLLVVLPSEKALAVVDLRPSPTVTTKIPIAMPDTAGTRTPQLVAATSRGTALVTFSGAGQGAINWLPLEIALATNQQRFRSDAPSGGIAWDLARSGDNSLVLLFQQGCMRAYDASGDTFGTCRQTNLLGGASVDQTGDHFVLGSSAYDAALNLLSTMARVSRQSEAPGGITPDGLYAYYSDPYVGLVRQRVSDGVILDRSPSTLFIPRRIFVSPDGTRLIAQDAGTLGQLTVVDLATTQLVVVGPAGLRATAVQKPGLLVDGFSRPGLPVVSELLPRSWRMPSRAAGLRSLTTERR
ncbi:MAG TPA: hypothetical protein VFT29_17965 [Gemmatimonadaceae bacterium]|nr:hypothetical protein [Gemmatimonadaceae bacterium]